ncbi:MAG: hypothetical protein PCFJNLEI_02641 [Verrucomicrobiae bacterium]|nr:hypothetical protein [Verrucomicrobiae bacterium]
MSVAGTEPTLKLSPQQLAQYRDEGYTVVRGLIPQADCAAVRAKMLDLLAGNYEGWPLSHFQVPDPSKYRNPKGGFVPLGIQVPAQQDETFRKVADHPNLQGVMAQLLGGPVKRFTDQALLKYKEINGQTFYHQDSYYWHLNPELGCNSWIALDTVGKDAIALGMLPGTHKTWTLTPHEEYFDEPSYHSATNSVAFKRFRIPLDQIDFSKEILLPMQPGDAAFFTNFTWHRAEPNRSGQHKCAYAIAYQRAQ